MPLPRTNNRHGPLSWHELYKFHHYCRNKPHCGEKLEEPVDNPRNAFCCRG